MKDGQREEWSGDVAPGCNHLLSPLHVIYKEQFGHKENQKETQEAMLPQFYLKEIGSH